MPKSKVGTALETIFKPMSDTYREQGIGAGLMTLPGAGDYKKWWAMPSHTKLTGDVGFPKSSSLLTQLRAFNISTYNAALAAAGEGEDHQLRALAKRLKV